MTNIIYTVGTNNAVVGDGWVKKVEEGYMVTYMTFDGYVDDGYFTTGEEAYKYLLARIKEAEVINKEYSELARKSPTGMY